MSRERVVPDIANFEQLITKYRPRAFDDVVGQVDVVKALSDLVRSGMSRTFLLTGPSGVGKTTLARIAAREVGCGDFVMEINAAKYTGVDDMRVLEDNVQFMPMGAKRRVVVIDEAHRLSANAWDALLKVLEEPPPHVLWFLCTTDPRKIPNTIKTRCTTLVLKPVSEPELRKLLTRVVRAEDMSLPDDVASFVLARADGSPRQLLSNIALCRKAGNRREAASLLQAVDDTDATLALCRFLVKGGSWATAVKLIESVDQPPESVRIIVCNYLAAALRGAKTDREAAYFLNLLDAFAVPYNTAEGAAPLYLSVGRILFAEN